MWGGWRETWRANGRAICIDASKRQITLQYFTEFTQGVAYVLQDVLQACGVLQHLTIEDQLRTKHLGYISMRHANESRRTITRVLQKRRPHRTSSTACDAKRTKNHLSCNTEEAGRRLSCAETSESRKNALLAFFAIHTFVHILL